VRRFAEAVKFAWWRLRLAALLVRYGYVPRFDWLYAYQWTGDDCWTVYYEDGESPMDAVREDWSYW
jgi:hypothetical protein